MHMSEEGTQERDIPDAGDNPHLVRVGKSSRLAIIVLFPAGDLESTGTRAGAANHVATSYPFISAPPACSSDRGVPLVRPSPIADRRFSHAVCSC